MAFKRNNQDSKGNQTASGSGSVEGENTPPKNEDPPKPPADPPKEDPPKNDGERAMKKAKAAKSAEDALGEREVTVVRANPTVPAGTDEVKMPMQALRRMHLRPGATHKGFQVLEVRAGSGLYRVARGQSVTCVRGVMKPGELVTVLDFGRTKTPDEASQEAVLRLQERGTLEEVQAGSKLFSVKYPDVKAAKAT